MTYELLIGAAIQRAYSLVHELPRHSIEAMLVALKNLAAKLDQDLQGGSGEASQLDLRWTTDDGRQDRRMNLSLPMGWSDCLESHPLRLLGLQFLNKVSAAKVGAKGKRADRDIWIGRVADIAASLGAERFPPATLGALCEAVYEELVRRTDAGMYESFDSNKMPRPRSQSTVGEYLRQLGYNRYSYPPRR